MDNAVLDIDLLIEDIIYNVIQKKLIDNTTALAIYQLLELALDSLVNNNTEVYKSYNILVLIDICERIGYADADLNNIINHTKNAYLQRILINYTNRRNPRPFSPMNHTLINVFTKGDNHA